MRDFSTKIAFFITLLVFLISNIYISSHFSKKVVVTETIYKQDTYNVYLLKNCLLKVKQYEAN